MDGGKTLVAMFTPVVYTLTVNANPSSGGAVFINGTALMGATPQDAGTTVEARAWAADGYTFTGWSGASTSTNNPVTFSITSSNQTLTANFKQDEHSHSWGSWNVISPASCTAPGVERRTCQTDNSHTETRQIPQITGSQCDITHTHSWGNWTTVTQATCTITGLRTRSCSCSETQSETIPQLSGVQCGGDIVFDTLNDTRDGQSYPTVQIGTQTWMAKNLNYNASGSKCYGEDGQVFVDWDENNKPIFTTLSNAEVQANCVKYGRLYDWATVMGLPSSCNSSSCALEVQSKHQGICPSGWHIPSDDEWETLVKYVDPNASGNTDNNAGTKLKSTSGWNDWSNGMSGNGTDEYGFSALPGGYGITDGSFYDVGNYGGWWSATERDADYVWYLDVFNFRGYMRRDLRNKGILLSVRCLKD